MSSSLALVLPGNRREVVKTTPLMTLGAVLAEVCGRPPRPLGDPAQFVLMNGKAVLDLSTAVRFAGLANGVRLDVVRNPAAAAAPQPVPQPPQAQPVAAAAVARAPAVAESAAGAAGGAALEVPSAAPGDAHATAGAAGGPDPAPTAAASAPAAAAREAATAASQQVAARVGRVVRVYSRGALLRAGAAPVVELPDSFYECVAPAACPDALAADGCVPPPFPAGSLRKTFRRSP
jgi:hypothetical protein